MAREIGDGRRDDEAKAPSRPEQRGRTMHEEAMERAIAVERGAPMDEEIEQLRLERLCRATDVCDPRGIADDRVETRLIAPEDRGKGDLPVEKPALDGDGARVRRPRVARVAGGAHIAFER